MTSLGRNTLVWCGVFSGLFLALAVWKRDILHSPPYWDCTIALWTEASFLVDSNFDYDRLHYVETHATIGGARTYMTSLLPTLLALLMKSFDDPGTVIFIYHLFVLACVSALATTMLAVLREEIGWPGAFLATSAMLTNPLFVTQAEMVNMDFPMVLLGYASAVAFWKRRYVWAAALSVGAYFMKANGAIVTLASFAYLALLFLLSFGSDEAKARRRPILVGLLVHGIALLVEVVVGEWGGTYRFHSDPRNRPLIARLTNVRFWAPDLTLLFLLGAFASAFLVLLAAARVHRSGTPRTWSAKLFVEIDRNDRFLLSWICVLGTLLAITRIILLPRYLLLALPFFFTILAILAFKGRHGRRFAFVGFTCLVAFNLLNSHGRFYPSISSAIGEEYARTGALLERSREYLADHEANQRAIKYLEENCSDDVIVAGHPFVYFLSLPRLGYVRKPLRGFTINEFSKFWPYFRDIREISAAEIPRHPVLITVRNTYYQYSLLFQRPWPEDSDDILLNDEANPPLIVFRKTWNRGEPTERELEDWYVDNLLPWATPTERLRSQSRFLLKQNRVADTLRRARREQEEYPLDVELGLFVAQLLHDQGRTAAAIEVAINVLASSPTPWDPKTASSECEPSVESEIRELLASTVASLNRRSQREDALAHFALATYHYHAGQYDVAAHHAELALASNPELTEARALAGELFAQSGDLDEAERHYQIAASAEPDSANFYFNFARLLVRNQKPEEARRNLEKGIRLRPQFRQAHDQLRLLAPAGNAPMLPSEAGRHP